MLLQNVLLGCRWLGPDYPLKMPIWLHLPLTILMTLAGVFGGALIGWLCAMGLLAGMAGAGLPNGILGLCVLAPFFLAGGMLGGGLVQATFRRYVPARCPCCGGRAYYRRGRPITYRCCSCRHVQVTPVTQRGKW
jgi:hypothetical protein